MGRLLQKHIVLLQLTGAALLWSSCSVFSTREAEPPITDSGTFLQPDTPEQVMQNIQSAVEELNALNYRRSLSDEISFTPTATALQRETIWGGWSKTDEEQYFATAVAAASTNAVPSLELFDRQLVPVTDRESVLDAAYRLTIPHTRAGAPTTVQGKLVWSIRQGADGLWSLAEWTDQEVGSEPSWSDFKAAFVK